MIETDGGRRGRGTDQTGKLPAASRSGGNGPFAGPWTLPRFCKGRPPSTPTLTLSPISAQGRDGVVPPGRNRPFISAQAVPGFVLALVDDDPLRPHAGPRTRADPAALGTGRQTNTEAPLVPSVQGCSPGPARDTGSRSLLSSPSRRSCVPSGAGNPPARPLSRTPTSAPLARASLPATDSQDSAGMWKENSTNRKFQNSNVNSFSTELTQFNVQRIGGL